MFRGGKELVTKDAGGDGGMSKSPQLYHGVF